MSRHPNELGSVIAEPEFSDTGRNNSGLRAGGMHYCTMMFRRSPQLRFLCRASHGCICFNSVPYRKCTIKDISEYCTRVLSLPWSAWEWIMRMYQP
jgi:hypothetical protein